MFSVTHKSLFRECLLSAASFDLQYRSSSGLVQEHESIQKLSTAR